MLKISFGINKNGLMKGYTMKRSFLNFVIDLISFINLLCLVFTGYVIKYVLPPGSGGMGRQFRGGSGGGHEQTRELWSMTRHQWGDIHFYIAALFLILMLVHIIMHWNWIKCYFKSPRIQE